MAEHFHAETPTRIEWIDDTSANIVFSAPAITLDALHHLSHDLPTPASLSPTHLRAANTFSSNPETRLQIRMAFSTDQKRPRAHEASRFYMMHPEHDPREQRRRESSSRNYEYKRRRYDRDENRRRRGLDKNRSFSAGMYDDHPGSNGAGSRRASFSTHSSIFSSEERNTHGESHVRGRRGDFYRPGKLRASARASRDRSASPGQDLETRSVRRRTPLRAYQLDHTNPTLASNSGKELFPSIAESNAHRNPNGRELFPNKKSASTLKKELFPTKALFSNHRRSDAFDAADETADLFASGLTVSKPAIFSQRNPFPTSSSTSASKDGRLQSSEPRPDSLSSDVEEDNDLNIRGISKLQNLGFSIRGAAADGARVGKVSNAGKELFAEKLQGRGGKRNKAQDMFY